MSDRSHNPSPARQVQWPRFVIEGVVIVASILLAFGIEAWWEGRQERERERAYVAALWQDFDQNLRLIDEAIADQESGVEMIVLLREQLSGSSPSVQRDSLNHHFALAFGVTTHQAVPTTYDELVSTGELGLLTNADLRTALGSWSTQLQSILGGSRRMHWRFETEWHGSTWSTTRRWANTHQHYPGSGPRGSLLGRPSRPTGKR